jgi:hypothetical protein
VRSYLENKLKQKDCWVGAWGWGRQGHMLKWGPEFKSQYCKKTKKKRKRRRRRKEACWETLYIFSH